MSYSSHYSTVLRYELLKEDVDICEAAIRRVITRLRRKHKGKRIQPLLCFRGLSGTGLAVALAQKMGRSKFYDNDIAMFYARKPGEKSHGNALGEIYLPGDYSTMRVPVFVDDLIDSGKSRSDVFTALYRMLWSSRNRRVWSVDLSSRVNLAWQYAFTCTGNGEAEIQYNRIELLKRGKRGEVVANHVYYGNTADWYNGKYVLGLDMGSA